jgi:hypothetical protein
MHRLLATSSWLFLSFGWFLLLWWNDIDCNAFQLGFGTPSVSHVPQSYTKINTRLRRKSIGKLYGRIYEWDEDKENIHEKFRREMDEDYEKFVKSQGKDGDEDPYADEYEGTALDNFYRRREYDDDDEEEISKMKCNSIMDVIDKIHRRKHGTPEKPKAPHPPPEEDNDEKFRREMDEDYEKFVKSQSGGADEDPYAEEEIDDPLSKRRIDDDDDDDKTPCRSIGDIYDKLYRKQIKKRGKPNGDGFSNGNRYGID